MEKQAIDYESLYDRLTCLTAEELMSVAQVATLKEVARLALALCLEQHDAAIEVGDVNASIDYENAAHYIDLLI